MSDLPSYEVHTRPTPGAPYTIHSIVLSDGRVVWEQLSPYGKGEVEERIRAFLHPTSLGAVLQFERGTGKPSRGKTGRPRKGEAWRGLGPDDPEAA